MRKLLLGIAAALLLTACNENREQREAATTDTARVVTDLMMSRRSISAYKDSTIRRETLKALLKRGINAPNGMNRQPWEVRIVDSRDFIDGITAVARAKDPRMAADSTATTMFRNAYTVIFVGAKDGCELDCGILGYVSLRIPQSANPISNASASRKGWNSSTLWPLATPTRLQRPNLATRASLGL